MPDKSTDKLFETLFGIHLMADGKTPSWVLLGLVESPREAQAVKSVAKQLLRKLESARGQFSDSEIRATAAVIKQAARDLLNSLEVPTQANSNAESRSPAPSLQQGAMHLVAKPVAVPVAIPVSRSLPSTSSSPVTISPIEQSEKVVDPVIVAPDRRRSRRSAAPPWLGWAVLLFLTLGLGVTLATVWLVRGDVWLVFESPPKSNDAKDNVESNRPNKNAGPTTRIDKSKSTEREQPKPTPAVETPAVETPAVETPATPDTQSPEPQLPSEIDNLNANTPQMEVKPTNENIQPSTDEAQLRTEAIDAQASSDVQASSDNPASGEPQSPDDARAIVIARQFELARIFLAAGRLDAAQATLTSGIQKVENYADFQTAAEVLQQFFLWRSEVYTTIVNRAPLLEQVGEIRVDDTFASVISANREQLVVRFAGQRRELALESLPWSVARGILEVTSSDRLEEDQRRKIVVDCLRTLRPTESQQADWIEALQAITISTQESLEYSPEKMQRLLSYLETGGNFRNLFNQPLDLPELPVESWESLYQTTKEGVAGNRLLMPRVQDADVARYELEAEIWLSAEKFDTTSVLEHLFTLHHIAALRGDFAFMLENLGTLGVVVSIPPTHQFWPETGRTFLQHRPTDPQIIEMLTRLQSLADEWSYSAETLAGLQSIGRQLAVRINDRMERQKWSRQF